MAERLQMKNVDVAVVGAGPAGLSAAVRARWVKSYRGVPCSVTVFDPAPPGGLARMRSTRLTGPGWHVKSDDLIGAIMADIEALCIPIESVSVDAARFGNTRWRLYQREKPLCSARALVLATGLRKLANEAEYFGRGLSLTYNGYEYIPQQLGQLTAPDNVREVLIIGNEKTTNLLPALDNISKEGINLTFLLDEAPSEQLLSVFGHKALFGRVLAFRGQEKLEEVLAVSVCGKELTLRCDLAFIDYVAFEIKPQKSVEVEGLERDSNGFIRVTRDGSTNLGGAFAAGDATGLFAMALKALSEGSVAGFSAYRYVFKQKFGYDPPLFAYAAQDRPIDPNMSDYPELLRTDIVELLGAREDVEKAAGGAAIPEGPFTYDSLCMGLGEQKARELVYALLDAKVCTLEPQEEAKRGPASRT